MGRSENAHQPQPARLPCLLLALQRLAPGRCTLIFMAGRPATGGDVAWKHKHLQPGALLCWSQKAE